MAKAPRYRLQRERGADVLVWVGGMPARQLGTLGVGEAGSFEQPRKHGADVMHAAEHDGADDRDRYPERSIDAIPGKDKTEDGGEPTDEKQTSPPKIPKVFH